MIKYRLFACLALAVSALVPVSASFAQNYYPPPVVRVAPPPLRHEMRPPPPGPRQLWFWQPGHWRWNGTAYYWFPGRWEHRPHPHARWIPPHWVPRHGGWVFVPGHWR